jgi:hypothetical protein
LSSSIQPRARPGFDRPTRPGKICSTPPPCILHPQQTPGSRSDNVFATTRSCLVSGQYQRDGAEQKEHAITRTNEFLCIEIRKHEDKTHPLPQTPSGASTSTRSNITSHPALMSSDFPRSVQHSINTPMSDTTILRSMQVPSLTAALLHHLKEQRANANDLTS